MNKLVLEWSLLLIAGIIAVVLGYIEFKTHPLVGIITQVISFLVVLFIFLSGIGVGDFMGWLTGNVFMLWVTVIALGLGIGNTIAEVF